MGFQCMDSPTYCHNIDVTLFSRVFLAYTQGFSPVKQMRYQRVQPLLRNVFCVCSFRASTATGSGIFIFTPLLGSSVLLQTLACPEYHPFPQSPEVSTLSLNTRTRLQLPGAACIRHVSPITSFKSSLKTSLFTKPFFSFTV